MSLEILTQEKIKDLTGGLTSRVMFGSRMADFISGYIRNRGEYDQQIMLICEVPWSASFGMFVRILETIGSRFFEELHAGVIYLVQPPSLDSLRENKDFYYDEDRRFILFGSRKLYKAFIHKVDEKRLRGLMSDEEYLEIFHRMNQRSRKLHAESVKVSLFDNSVLSEYRRVFREDPLVRPYLKMAIEQLADAPK